MRKFFTKRTWKRLALTGWLIPCVGLAFPQIAAWQFGNPASVGDEVTYAATSLDNDLDYGTLSRGTGVAAAAWARGFSANGWDVGATQGDAIANDEYYQVILEASAGYAVSLSTLDARLRRSGTGPDAYIWRYSVDGNTFHDIGTPVSDANNTGKDQAQIDLSGINDLQDVPSGTTIILRLYAWGATNASGVFAIGRYGANITTNSLAIDGTVDMIPTGPVVITAWQFSNPATNGGEVTYDATTLDANLETSTLSRGAGIAATTLGRAFSANNWDAQNQGDAITNDEYFEFTIQAKNGYEVSLSTLDAKMRRTGTGPNTYIWRYSVDGSTFHDIGTATAFVGADGGDGAVQAQVDLSGINALQNATHGAPITLRLYAWGASAAGGTFAIGRYAANNTTNSLSVEGTVEVSSAPPITVVEFDGTSSTVSEGDGTEELTLTIANPSATAGTSVDVVLVNGDAARIDNYTTQTVTWNAGESGTKTVTITLTDNNDCDGNEQLTFELQDATGGEFAEIGNDDTYVLTVEDNDQVTLDVPVAAAASNVDETSFTANWNGVTGADGYYLDVYADGTSGLLAEWTFAADQDLTPSSGTSANLVSEITTTAVGNITYPQGADGAGDFSISSDGWDNGDDAKYWQVDLNTVGYAGLTVSSAQRSSNTGPRDFKLQYRVGQAGTWTDVAGASITVASNNFTTGVLSNVALPAECGNQAELSLRWIMTSNTAVNNAAVAEQGTNRIDNISINATGGTMYVLNNEDVGNVTQYNVTGLEGGTEYHYVVRAYSSCDTSDDSNEIDVATTPSSVPDLSAGTLNDFGSLCLNASSAPQSFHVDGENLTGDDVTVAALAGFSFSTSETGTYSSSLSIPQAGGTFSQDIWVIFTPTAVQSYNGNITVGGGGAADIHVQAAGAGVNTGATASTGSASGVGQSNATLNGSITDEGCSTVTDYGFEWSETQGFTPGTGTQEAASNLSNGDFSVGLSNLDLCGTYYFRAYATNNAGTAYGAEASFTTDPIDAPVATAGSGILTEEFMANWNAVAGATGYFLDVSTSPTFGSSGPATLYFGDGRDDLPDGWSQTGLGTDYTTNTNYGLSSPSLKFDNSNDQLTTPVLSGPANSLSFWYKGQGTAESASTLTIEAFDGNGWSTIGTLTGIPTNYTDTWSTTLDESDNYIQFRFTYTKVSGNLAFDDLTIDYHGFHPSFVAGYEDLAVAGTSRLVDGLTMSTTYYYRVRAAADGCVSDNSNTIQVTTLACQGNVVVVSIFADDHPEEIFWELVDASNNVLADGAPAQANAENTETLCLGTGGTESYGFAVYDFGGDGITNGGWELRTMDGKLIMRDAYDVHSYSSPIMPPHTPSYGAYHTFALPLGPVDIHPDECGIMDNQPDNKVYAVKQGGKNYQGGTLNYQFEFINPDSGRVRRTKKPRNYVLWSELTNPDLVAGVTYFARVRTDKSGPLANASYGAGCEMAMGLPTACTGLIDDPNNQYYSCGVGVERRFRPNSQIFAWPVYGATKYKFRIFNTGEGYDQEFISNNYKLELSWPVEVAPKLRNGYTYQVQVSALVNGVWTNYCSSCPVTINNYPSGHLVEVFGEATLWPNPAHDGQVNLNIDGIAADVQHITVDVKDIYGQHVYGQEFGNIGERFNTVLQLPGDIATGIYLVNITVNGEVTTKRLSIVR